MSWDQTFSHNILCGLDLWGAIRRQVESARGTAEATDAQLAGQRLSIAASIAIDYFELRQADIDIQLLTQQKDIDSRILYMTQEAYRAGQASNDQVLAAQDRPAAERACRLPRRAAGGAG